MNISFRFPSLTNSITRKSSSSSDKDNLDSVKNLPKFHSQSFCSISDRDQGSLHIVSVVNDLENDLHLKPNSENVLKPNSPPNPCPPFSPRVITSNSIGAIDLLGDKIRDDENNCQTGPAKLKNYRSVSVGTELGNKFSINQNQALQIPIPIHQLGNNGTTNDQPSQQKSNAVRDGESLPDANINSNPWKRLANSAVHSNVRRQSQTNLTPIIEVDEPSNECVTEIHRIDQILRGKSPSLAKFHFERRKQQIKNTFHVFSHQCYTTKTLNFSFDVGKLASTLFKGGIEYVLCYLFCHHEALAIYGGKTSSAFILSLVPIQTFLGMLHALSCLTESSHRDDVTFLAITARLLDTAHFSNELSQYQDFLQSLASSSIFSDALKQARKDNVLYTSTLKHIANIYKYLGYDNLSRSQLIL
jgi:hypothetical protein